MPTIHASRHHGLLDLAALRKRAKRLLNALKHHQADDAREQLRTLGLPGPIIALPIPNGWWPAKPASPAGPSSRRMPMP